MDHREIVTAPRSLGQLLDKMKIDSGKLPTLAVEDLPDNSSYELRTNSIGMYYPEPLNDKKLFGANIDVLQTLDSIDFNRYADGALRQNIAFIKLWGDDKSTPDVLAKEIFKDIEINSEQTKCFKLKHPKECQYSISTSFKFPGFDNIEETQEISNSLLYDLNPPAVVFDTDASNFRLDKSENIFKEYAAVFHKNSSALPNELKEIIPKIPKPSSLLEQGQSSIEVIQKIKRDAQNYIKIGKEILNSLPSTNEKFNPILETINKVEEILGGIDKLLRVSGTILKQTGKIIDIFDKELGEPPLDISINEPIIEPPLDIDLDTPIIEPPQEIGIYKPRLDISIDEPIYSADVKGIEKISTYSCKEVLSKKNGMWLFLFNPSQLSYTYSSDYAISDVWNTSDGKPLHWKGNNNPELQFNDILLSGYMFGRKVEYLAQGLKDLMGFANSTSPPVLEFVWGSKTFGPCVMKNLNITENMWDYGELVGATCSFTLVAVPEWVVNDGQVDIFDPSRTPVYIPTIPDEAPTDTNTDETDDTTLKGGSSDSSSKDPIITIKDPPKSNNATLRGSILPAPQNKSQFCSTIYAQRDNILKHEMLYERALKDVKTIRGTDPEKIVGFLGGFNGNYASWFRGVEAATKSISTAIIPSSSLSIVESFKKTYPECFPKNSSEPHGMSSLNPYKIKPSSSYLISAMKCRKNFLKYSTDIYRSKCFKTPSQISLPGKDADSGVCLLVKNTKDAAKYLLNATGTFPNKFIEDIPADRLSNLFNGIDILLTTGLYNTKLVEKTMRNRQDLKEIYTSIIQIQNVSINFPSAITKSYDTCKNTAVILRTISNDTSARQGKNMHAKELINLINTFIAKCYFPMRGLANKLVENKIIRCEKK